VNDLRPGMPPADVPSRPAPRPPARRPWATYALIGLTALVFLLQSLSTSLLGTDLPLAWGAKINALISQGELWRLITPLVLHAGILHAGFNLYALYIIGPQAEAIFGRWRFLTVYLVSGMGGVLASYLLTAEVSVGASSAIFGLIGALLIFFYRHRKALGEFGRRGLVNLLVVAGINLVLGLSPGIDNWGHVGGLLAGALLALVLGPDLRLERVEITGQTIVSDRRAFRRTWPFALLVGLVILAVALFIRRPG
jgi:rhomboid protease GluP